MDSARAACAARAKTNAPGVWHTADVQGRATALFITAGEGTKQRTRDRA